MRILITGSTSLIGRHIGEVLRAGHDVAYAGRSGGEIALDLRDDFDCFPQGHRFDAVVHCAAAFGGESDAALAETATVNAVGTLNMARFARGAGARHFTYISSVSATYPSGHPYHGPYSVTKRHGEELAELYCARHGLSLAILRPTQVYGDDAGFARHQPLLYALIEQAATGRDIKLHGSIDPLRNYLHVDDLAAIAASVVERSIDGCYFVAASRSVRLSEIARLACEIFGSRSTVSFDPSKPSVPEVAPVDGSPILSLTGRGGTVDLADGIARIRDARLAR